MKVHLSQKPKRKQKAKRSPRKAGRLAAALVLGLIGMAAVLALLSSSRPAKTNSALRDALEGVAGVKVTSIGGHENGDEVVINFRAEHLDGGRQDIVRLACELLTTPDADYRLRLIGAATFYHAGTPNNIPIIEVYLRKSDQLEENCADRSSDFDWDSLAYFYSEYHELNPILLTPLPYGR